METPKNNALNPAATEPSANTEVSTIESVPQDVRRLNRWMLFRCTRNEDGTVDKEPRSVHGGFAKVNDPATWATYEEALRLINESPNNEHELGFVIDPTISLVCYDIDKARASGAEPWPQWVYDEVKRYHTFSEDSVSGRGKHIWLWGSIDLGKDVEKNDGTELFVRKMVVVSPGFADSWQEIRIAEPGELDELRRRILNGTIRRKPIMASTNAAGLSLEQLEAGESGDDVSESDYQYVAMLAEQGLTDAAIDARFRASKRMRDKWDEKHRGDGASYGEMTIERARKAQAAKATQKTEVPKVLEFALPAMPKGKTREYVLKPAKRFSGWFPRGAVSVIGGSSNAGKTSLILELLVAQERGGEFLGREGSGLSFLWLSADRGEEDNLETLERLELLDAEGKPTIDLDYIYAGAQGFVAAEQTLRKIEEHEVPAVVFVEGADGLVEDPNKTQIVAPFLSLMRKIAEHYRIAIILSVGAPKSKPGEAHTLKRDRIFGSQIWTRMTSTVLVLSYVGDGMEAARDLDVSYKNAAPESFPLEINAAGRFVPRVDAPDVDAFELWARKQDWFTRAEAVAAMAPKGADAGMSRSTVYNRIKAMLEKKNLENRFQGDKEELRFNQPESTEADPFAEVATV